MFEKYKLKYYNEISQFMTINFDPNVDLFHELKESSQKWTAIGREKQAHAFKELFEKRYMTAESFERDYERDFQNTKAMYTFFEQIYNFVFEDGPEPDINDFLL